MNLRKQLLLVSVLTLIAILGILIVFACTYGMASPAGLLDYVGRFANKQGYAFERYRTQTYHMISVLEKRLEGREWIVGDDYSIADMIAWPWVLISKAVGMPLDDHPNVSAWRGRVKERPAVQRGVSLGKESRPPQRQHDEEARKILFEQK